MTKEEIQRSITELQYQYQSLIREGSYKLAKIRKERIKKLREQLKQLNKTKVQDSMDILRLCGYAADAMAGPGYKIKFGKDPHGNEEVEVKLDSGQIKSFRGTDATREAYKWIKANVTDNDECPTFTKGSKDDDATEHGSIKQYGKGTETESMDLSDDPVLAQDSWTSVYEKAFGNQSMNTLESLKSKLDVIRHFQKLGIDPNSADAKEAMRRWFNSDSKLVKDGGPGSGIKGHRTPKKEEPKKVKASTKLTPSQKEVARYLSEEAELSSPEEIKKAFGEEAPDSYKKSYNNALNFPVGSKAYVGSKKVEIEDYMSDDDGEVIYAMLSNGGMVDASKLRSNKPTKDADPKVAEAQAIINLCGGIF